MCLFPHSFCCSDLRLVVLHPQLFLCLCDFCVLIKTLEQKHTESRQNVSSLVGQMIFFTETSGLLLVKALK